MSIYAYILFIFISFFFFFFFGGGGGGSEREINPKGLGLFQSRGKHLPVASPGD